MDRKTELKGQLRELSSQFLAGNLSDEELTEVRQNMRGLTIEILEITRQENRRSDLRTAGLRDDVVRKHFEEKGIIFRNIER